MLSSAERGPERAEGQAPRCSAQGKEVLHEQRKMNVLLPSNTAFLPALEDPAVALAFFSPDLAKTPLQQVVAASSPVPLTITTTSPSHGLCRTLPSTAPLCCE